jgi:hypothetical protein
MLSEEHGKEYVLGTATYWMCIACQLWLSSHDDRMARREIVHYQHTLAGIFMCCVHVPIGDLSLWKLILLMLLWWAGV